jgi:hypothetical protein
MDVSSSYCRELCGQFSQARSCVLRTFIVVVRGM